MLNHAVDPDRNPVDVLADEFARACRMGTSPSISDYVTAHPDLAQEILEVFPAIAAMEQLSRGEQMERDDSDRIARIHRQTIERIGDYRIVREIGRGGMGIVYQAVQESLGRVVAIKVLTANVLAQPRQLKRFEREAQAAARLHHTNIVPIFGVGEEDGLHYYVMQYIDGHGLDQIVAQQRDLSICSKGESAKLAGVATSQLGRGDHGSRISWRQIAQYGIQVARAVDYAHRQGVLHRDIKPANLLIDRSEIVWVADFGLAKVFGDEDLTQSGDVMGTLRYMAPEQFEGVATEASDIYSLGVTLWELATLQPAFNENAAKDVVLRITQQGVPRPRTIDPRIPRDLETIILKASAFNQRHRYKNATEVADDLQRFLHGEAINARRVTRLRRGVQWSRRNPALAAFSSLSALLLLLVAIVASIGYVHVDEARRQAVVLAALEQHTAQDLRAANQHVLAESERARQEFRRAEGNLELALQAFEEVIGTVSGRGFPVSLEFDLDEDSPLQNDPLITPADAELLQRLLEFYMEFAQRNGAHATVQVETAKAFHRIGDIRLRLGQFEQAVKSHSEALSLYGLLIQQSHHGPDLVVASVDAWNQRGIALAKLGRMEEAFQSFADAQDQLLNQPAEITQTRACRFALAKTLNAMGSLRFRDSTSFASFVRPFLPRRRILIAGSAEGRSTTFRRSRGNYRAALEILKELIAEDPQNPEYRLALARCHRNCVPSAWRANLGDEAARCLEESIVILAKLEEDFPGDPRFSYELADILSIDSPALRGTSFDANRKQRLLRAVEIAERLDSASPNQPEYRVLHANALHRLGLVLLREGDVSGAIGSLMESREFFEELIDQFPPVLVYATSLARVSNDLGAIFRNLQQFHAARDTLEDALLRLLEVPETNQKNVDAVYRSFAILFEALTLTNRMIDQSESEQE